MRSYDSVEGHGMSHRYCLALDLKDNPKLIEQYKYWHRRKNIWPEIPQGMRDAGITDMEIYLLGTRMFMIMETNKDVGPDQLRSALIELPRQKEWEDFTSAFQNPLDMAKPGEKWALMERIFKLEKEHENDD
jgi:L-rhamnose mutarotase